MPKCVWHEIDLLACVPAKRVITGSSMDEGGNIF